MMGCEGVRDLAQAHLDGQLAPEERERLEHHLRACPACRHVVATYRQLFAALAAPAVPEVPLGLAAGALARVAAEGRRRRAWQSLALAAALLVVGGGAVLLTWGALSEELVAVSEADWSLEAWRTTWDSVVALAEGAAATGTDWLGVVPGGPLVLVLLAAALVAQLYLAYRWRTLISPDGRNQARVLQ